jgi:glutamate dehydrogenase (NAD(P)+)
MSTIAHAAPQDATATDVDGGKVVPLETVRGFVVYDLPDAPTSSGGTRLAADVTVRELRLLARAMTYKFAIARLPIGGAKVGLVAGPSEREAVLSRFRREISPLLARGCLATGPDLGTSEDDFAYLPRPGEPGGIAAERIGGVPAEEYLTGFAAAAAVDAAVGIAGRTVALEGVGKAGSGIARELVRRGARLVAASTVEGCAIAPAGLDVETLLEARAAVGDACIHHAGGEVRRCEVLWDVAADVVVPGARTGVLDASTAGRLAARAVVPVANAPYTRAGLGVLRARGIAAHADFLVSAGGVMAYYHEAVARATNVAGALATLDWLMREVVLEVNEHPGGPYALPAPSAPKGATSTPAAASEPERPSCACRTRAAAARRGSSRCVVPAVRGWASPSTTRPVSCASAGRSQSGPESLGGRRA